MSAALERAIAAALGRPVTSLRPVAGGDLNAAWQATLTDGKTVFVKGNDDAAPGAFTNEAAGLRWLGEATSAGGPPVPEPLAVADEPGAPRFLVLPWLEAGRGPTDEARFGRELAALHQVGAPRFGGDAPLTLGPLTLPNEDAADWPSFYAEQRLAPLTRMANDRDALPPGTVATLDRVIARLPDLAGPAEPPARLHGDLWSGNVLHAADGRTWLIDPAAYGGHREVDLAMLALFGSPGRSFLPAYEEVAPLADGHEDRVALWQLLPLLVHAVLFGGGYGASVGRAAALLSR